MRRNDSQTPRRQRPEREQGAILEATRFRRSVALRPGGQAVGRLRRFVLAAALCFPILASGGARAGDLAVTGTGDVREPRLQVPGAPARSFGLVGRTCGSGEGAPGPAFEPSPSGFRFCLGLGVSAEPDAPALAWGPLQEPSFRTPPAAGAPLHGVRNELSPLGRKYLRGTLIITGTALASGVVLAVLPKEFSKWEDDSFSRGGSNFVRAWSELPVWDGDVAFHNWIGHPYAGAFYYNMMRSQGGTIRQSFAFSVFQSVVWEYLVEAVAEQPSVQDLIATPIMGSVLGEAFHRWSVAILRKGRLNFGQKALVFFLNPSYVINNGYRPPE